MYTVRPLSRASKCLTGDVSDLTGDVSGLRGHVSGLRCDVSGLEGNCDLIPMASRDAHSSIAYWAA